MAVSSRSGLDIAVLARDAKRLPLLPELELFRIAQEALANIEKHADATRVTITWRSDGHVGVLALPVDGRGFPIVRAARLDLTVGFARRGEGLEAPGERSERLGNSSQEQRQQADQHDVE